MGSATPLTDRIARGSDRRSTDLSPIVERREAPALPEWRRRALEARDRVGFVAVADLTRGAA